MLSSFQVGDAGNKQKIEQFCSTAVTVVVVTMRRTLKKLNSDSSEWLLLFLFFAFVFVRGGLDIAKDEMVPFTVCAFETLAIILIVISKHYSDL